MSLAGATSKRAARIRGDNTGDLILIRHTNRYAQQDPLRSAVAAAINAFASASIEISELIGRGALAGITGRSQGRNADGDEQKDLDVLADQIIRHALKSVPYAACVSEEAATPEIGDPSALISIAYDPLDGSSNIETNMTVGTIFSVLPHRRSPFAGPGSEQLAAGFVVYGPQTSLVLTLGRGVDIFTLDRAERTYRLIRKQVQIPVDTAEYAINASNYRHWEQPVRDFIEDCLAGVSGPHRKNFNMRWNASLDERFHKTSIDEANRRGTGSMLVDSSFEELNEERHHGNMAASAWGGDDR